MKNSIAPSASSVNQKRIQNSAPVSIKGAKIIRCGYCENTFSAAPRTAVCLKCKRPANAPLSLPNKLFSLIVFPFGLLKAILLRASQPYAASQALWLSIAGAAGWAATYFLVLRDVIAAL